MCHSASLDFQGELARISAMQPDAVFTFMPGGMGINLVRQYSQAGLTDRVPFLSAFTVDETNLPAQQADALGMYSSATWTPDMEHARQCGIRRGLRGSL